MVVDRNRRLGPPFSAKAVANYILDLAAADGKRPSGIAVMILVYLAHGWHLALLGRPLIDEPVVAGKYGPDIHSLEQEFSTFFGSGPVREHAQELRRISPGRLGLYTPRLPNDGDPYVERAKQIVREAWQTYRKYTAVQLANMTHQPGTPWHKVWIEMGGRPGADIPDELIAEHFTKKMAKA